MKRRVRFALRGADTNREVLAIDRVRFVGDAVALVVAETLAQAKDAAERVMVDYRELPAVADTATADAEAAPLQPTMPPNCVSSPGPITRPRTSSRCSRKRRAFRCR